MSDGPKKNHPQAQNPSCSPQSIVEIDDSTFLDFIAELLQLVVYWSAILALCALIVAFYFHWQPIDFHSKVSRQHTWVCIEYHQKEIVPPMMVDEFEVFFYDLEEEEENVDVDEGGEGPQAVSGSTMLDREIVETEDRTRLLAQHLKISIFHNRRSQHCLYIQVLLLRGDGALYKLGTLTLTCRSK
jgi:hypothetical protein